MVDWLGFQPVKITYSSDNFQQLYDDAEKLINLGNAYVCRCTDSEVKLQRGEGKGGARFRCEHANQTIEYNLTEFRKMRDGEYKPQEAFLRMKQNIESGNPQMWDLAAYRVLNSSHHRTGSKWKVYPTYDFTHCLCDSYEGIVWFLYIVFDTANLFQTHSLCTTEFVLSRESYEWLNQQIVEWQPMQR